MTIALVESPHYRLTLDPVCAEDRVPSVAFDIAVELQMPFQRATLLVKECWFSHEQLNSFEAGLLNLLSAEHGTAKLINLSEKPILQLTREGNSLRTVFSMSDTLSMAETTFTFNGYAAELDQVHRNLSSYEKWW